MNQLFKTCTFALVASLGISGCVSNKSISDQQATFVEEGRVVEADMNITASFKPRLCDSSLGYIQFAIDNTSDDWVEMKDMSVIFPYASDTSDFSVIVGDRLSAWRDSKEAELRAAAYNDSVMSAVGMMVSASLLGHDNKNVQRLGGAMFAGQLLTRGIEARLSRRSDAAAPARTDGNSHLLSGDIIIPPEKARQYWMLVQASPTAPLLGYLSLSYTSADGERQYAVVPVDRSERCHWQSPRKKVLRDWALENELGKAQVLADGRVQYVVTDDMYPALEAQYQKSLQQ